MELKFYLNKFLKVDNIEHYSLAALTELRKVYEDFLETSSGTDPDFPLINFGDSKGGEKYTKDSNKQQIQQKEEDEDEQSKGTENILSLSRNE